jgi:hypothetical protein
MADPTPVAAEVTPPPPPRTRSSAPQAFVREPFVVEGEDPAVLLAPGTARRRALDAALAELEVGANVPSVAWRQRWSLLLGLDRLLCQEEPHLADGTVLSAHQVDALSGTLTALLAESGNGSSPAGTAEPIAAPLASVAIPGEEDLDDDDEPEEPQDWEEDSVSETAADGQLPEAPEDPNAQALLVRACDRRRQDRRGARLRRGLAHGRHADPHPSPQPRRPVPRRAARSRLRGPHRARAGAWRGSRRRPVTVETYQWFVRNAGNVSDAYTIVICDEAHTALGEKTSASIRNWHEPVFVGMTATGALIARHVTDLFPTQTSRFDLAQAARRGVISPLRCVRIPPGPGVRTIAKVPLRRGEVDTSSTRRCWPSCSTSCRSTSPSPTSTRRASTACRASSTRPACGTPTTSRRRSATSA